MKAAILFTLMRPGTLPAVVAGVVGGAVSAEGGWPEPLTLLLAVVSALLLTGASNILNQIADIETDRINRPDRPLPAGHATARGAWIAFGLLSLVALALAALVNVAYLACVTLTLPLTAAYSLPPMRTKRIPFLANATIATPRGLLMVVAGWAAGGGFARHEAWLLGGAAWLYVFGASATKDFADVEGDQATGCVTLPILWGPRRAARFVAFFLVAPFVGYPLAGALGWLPGGIGPWAVLGGVLAALGGIAGVLLVRDPAPPPGGRPHPAWGLMYLQLAAMHVGAAILFSSL